MSITTEAPRAKRALPPLMSLTEGAADRLRALYAKGEHGKLLRIAVRTKGCSGLSYDLSWTDEAAPSDDPGRAARLLELAQRTADDYLAEAKRTADSLVTDAEERARTAVGSLEDQRAELEARVGALRAFEAEVRTRLTGYFEAQLNDLRSTQR